VPNHRRTAPHRPEATMKQAWQKPRRHPAALGTSQFAARSTSQIPAHDAARTPAASRIRFAYALEPKSLKERHRSREYRARIETLAASVYGIGFEGDGTTTLGEIDDCCDECSRHAAPAVARTHDEADDAPDRNVVQEWNCS
jgi:hypothetical protein